MWKTGDNDLESDLPMDLYISFLFSPQAWPFLLLLLHSSFVMMDLS